MAWRSHAGSGGEERMTAQLEAGTRPRAGDDRTAVLTLVLIDSLCVIAGFAVDSFFHVRQFGLDYPLIVHFHAVTFTSWLLLFNVQVWLMRKRRPDLHRKLGQAMVWLACVMLVLGPATAYLVDARLAPPGVPPVFICVQLTDMAAFAGLTFTAVSQRSNPAAHKRLMLMGLFYLSDAGFARLVNPILATPFAHTALEQPIGLYAGTNIMALALGVYDIARYRRLHPAYVAALAYILVLQGSALYLLTSPGWATVVAWAFSPLR